MAMKGSGRSAGRLAVSKLTYEAGLSKRCYTPRDLADAESNTSLQPSSSSNSDIKLRFPSTALVTSETKPVLCVELLSLQKTKAASRLEHMQLLTAEFASRLKLFQIR